MRKSMYALGIGMAVAALVLASVAVAGAASGDLIFHDDFTGDLSAWFFDTTTDGRPDYFSVEGGAMVFAPVWFGNAFAGDPTLTDYSIEVEYEVLEYGIYGNTRFFVRMNKLWEGYAVTLLPDKIMLMRFDGNWDRAVVLAQVEQGIEPGTKHVVKLTVKDNRLTLYLDGQLLTEAEDEDAKYAAGSFGLRADHDSIMIYDFKAFAE